MLGLAVLVIDQAPSARLRMIVCDVGQGDGIILTKGNYQVVVDGGPSGEKMLDCLARQMPFFDRRIELIVLTNTDYDHLRGLNAVIERYIVTQFVTADGVHASDALTQFRETLARRNVEVRGVERGDLIRVGAGEAGGNLEFRVLWPPDIKEEYVAVLRSQMNQSQREQILGESAKRGNLNERSVVLLLLEDNRRILLMGDAGDQAEKALVELSGLPDIDVLKVGHHGSKYASSLEFLRAIDPEVAVISVGNRNRYGHPTAETLARLKQVGAEIRRTDTEGEVVLKF